MPTTSKGDDDADHLQCHLCPKDRVWRYKRQAGLNRHIRKAHSGISKEVAVEEDVEPKKKKTKLDGEILIYLRLKSLL